MTPAHTLFNTHRSVSVFCVSSLQDIKYIFYTHSHTVTHLSVLYIVAHTYITGNYILVFRLKVVEYIPLFLLYPTKMFVIV